MSQIRVLYKILGTNDLLLKIYKHDDGKCSFCHEELETISHLFIECPIVMQFWSELRIKVHNVLQIDLNISPEYVILGTQGTCNLSTPVNTIYLAAKMYIFKTSRKKRLLSVNNFYTYLDKIYQEQEFISKLDFKQEGFRKAWGNFYNLFMV